MLMTGTRLSEIYLQARLPGSIHRLRAPEAIDLVVAARNYALVCGTVKQYWERVEIVQVTDVEC